MTRALPHIAAACALTLLFAHMALTLATGLPPVLEQVHQ